PEVIRVDGPFAAVITGIVSAHIPPKLRGANLSGMEFAGFNFVPTEADIDYYIARGVNCIRLPAKWERIQPVLNAPLAINGDGSGAAEKYKEVVDYITSQGVYCIVDIFHNYGRYTDGSTTFSVGSYGLPASTLLDSWERVVDYLGDNEYIIYDLMNEPALSASRWANTARSIGDKIRSLG